MNIGHVYAIFIRQMFLLRHNKTRFVNIFFWSIIDIVLWGFITRYFAVISGISGADLVATLLGAVIFWDFLTRVQQDIMRPFLEDVWTQNFLNLFSSPLTTREYVGGLIATSIVTTILGFNFMLVLAGIAFGYSVLLLGFHFLSFFAILFVFGIALGIFTIIDLS